MTYLANMTGASKQSSARPAIAARWAAPCMAVLVLALPACAQTSRDRTNEAIANTLKLRTDVGPSADFVEKSRPPTGSVGFVPVNAPRSEPSGRALQRDEIKAMEAELDAARVKHDGIVRRQPAKKVLRSAAGDPYVAPKKKQTPKCVLTCEVK